MIEWKIRKEKIENLKFNERNPRTFTKKGLKDLENSIKKYSDANIITINADNTVLGGHARLTVMKKMGITEVDVKYPSKVLTEKQCDEILIRLNANTAGEWDIQKLQQEFDLNDLEDWGLDIDLDIPELYGVDEKNAGSIEEQFIVCPFSILDTRKANWQNRKKEWLNITGNITATKENVLYHKDSLMDQINGGSSNFDPVLAELMIKWFNVQNGKILDPFGGEQTKGVVAGELGYPYSACEIRQEQVDLNIDKTKQYNDIKYYCGDSNNISQIIKERDFDFCFTSPPYYDLEVYSKNDMSALGTYEEFMVQYKNIFQQCYDMLANNRFLVVKVGEIRNKTTGEYRNFVGDNLSILKSIGFKYINEFILINPCGTVPLRLANQFNRGRKAGKVHQNILVFFKGDISEIKNIYKELDFSIAEGINDNEVA